MDTKRGLGISLVGIYEPTYAMIGCKKRSLTNIYLVKSKIWRMK